MRLFVCTDHASHYPVGCASVVVAEDEASARELLDAALREHRLEPDDYTLGEVATDTPTALVLNDGNY